METAKLGNALQTDAALLYYKAGSPDRINKDSDSPYTTYKYHGLPPGPICIRILTLLKPRLNRLRPIYGIYLFFIDGYHHFFQNLRDHLQNIARYLE